MLYIHNALEIASGVVSFSLSLKDISKCKSKQQDAQCKRQREVGRLYVSGAHYQEKLALVFLCVSRMYINPHMLTEKKNWTSDI